MTIPLTLSSPVVSNGYTSKCSGSYWSKPPFQFFDIRALWCSVLWSAQMSTSKMTGHHQCPKPSYRAPSLWCRSLVWYRGLSLRYVCIQCLGIILTP